MGQKQSIAQLLERLSEEFREDPDYQVYHFLNRLGATTLKGLDVYCFRECEMTDGLRHFHASVSSYTLIHPFPKSSHALSLALTRNCKEYEITYDITARTFDLTKTAGDPVDLMAVRNEKLKLDILKGETAHSVLWSGQYRDNMRLFERRYVKKLRLSLKDRYDAFFVPKEKRQVIEQILYDLERLEQGMRWIIDNPMLNRLRSREAFNY